MISSNVAKRYARAFFDVAGEEKKYEEYYRELQRFTCLMNENSNLRDFFINPVFDREAKKNVLNEIIRKLGFSLPTANFIRLLVDKRRIADIQGIEENYRKLMDETVGIARVQVMTAFPLQSELSARLRKALESMTGKKVDMQVEDDRSLLGGIVVRIGDKVYDGSLKVQLDNMMKLLEEEM